MAVLTAFYSRAGENYFAGEYRRIAVGNTEKAAKLLAGLTGMRGSAQGQRCCPACGWGATPWWAQPP